MQQAELARVLRNAIGQGTTEDALDIGHVLGVHQSLPQGLVAEHFVRLAARHGPPARRIEPALARWAPVPPAVVGATQSALPAVLAVGQFVLALLPHVEHGIALAHQAGDLGRA